MAEEQEQVSKSPPGRTAFSASALIFWYFRLARGKSRMDGASLGGSHTTTSYSSVLAFKNAETSLASKLQIPSSAFRSALRRELDGSTTRVDADTGRSAVLRRRQREAPGVAVQIQDALASTEWREKVSIISLVAVEARFLAPHIDLVYQDSILSPRRRRLPRRPLLYLESPRSSTERRRGAR